MVKRPGRKATRSEQLLYEPLIRNHFSAILDKFIIHHVTEDDKVLQLEFERHRTWSGEITFGRVVL